MLFHTTGRNDIWNNTLNVTVWRRYKNIRWNNIENIDILPGGLDYTGRYKNVRWNNIKNMDILPARLDYTGIGIELQQEIDSHTYSACFLHLWATDVQQRIKKSIKEGCPQQGCVL